MKTRFLNSLLTLTLLLAPLYYLAAQKIYTAQEDSSADNVEGRRMAFIYVQGGLMVPGGDMKKSYGSHYEIGGGFLYKTRKNWLLGADFNAIFGDTYYDNPLLAISTPEGYIIGNDGKYATIDIYERGYKFPWLRAGKLFPVKGKGFNEGSGFIGTVGAGALVHYLQIDDRSQTSPQITGNYKFGYDRYTSGIAFNQTVGFQYIALNRAFNFLIAFDITEGFTRMRHFQADKQTFDTRQRLDIIYGLRLAWVLPIFDKRQADYYID